MRVKCGTAGFCLEQQLSLCIRVLYHLFTFTSEKILIVARTAILYTIGQQYTHNPPQNSANHNALDSWPIRAHLASQNDELFKDLRVSESQGIEEQQ